MPYPRKYQRGYRRRKTYRKKGSSGFGGMSLSSAWKTAKWAANAAWKLKGLVNSELKKVDYTAAGTNVTNAGTVVDLNNIGQGDTDNARNGNSLYVRSLNWKGYLARPTAGDVVQCVRLVVFMDTQQVGDTAPTLNNVLDNITPYSHLNSDTVGRFKILCNKVLTLDTAKSLSQQFEINIPMRHHIRYNGTTGTDVQKGGLYLGFLSTQGTSNYPTISYEARLCYHDN